MIEQIGPYKILRELGRGGMGVVHLARDARLERDVAIKALPEDLAQDPVRLERFEREAKSMASLNHPNVAGIHGVEEQDGSRYLVLEFVDGESLADRLDRGPLHIDEANELAAQIAAGIEAAHEAGVIHRDLKPANIMITPEGVAKVLDFGLARTDDGQSSTGVGFDGATIPQNSPTIVGAILGTAAYMSPEQARGRRVDKRTDIWAFGVLIYEMLVGSNPFKGETATDSIGAVIHKDIDLSLLPSGTPAHVRGVLDRCLQRDKSLRYRDIGDARLDLLSPMLVSASESRRSGIFVWAGACVAILIGLAGLIFGLTKPVSSGVTAMQPELPIVEFDFRVSLVRDSFSSNADIAISDDGRSIAVQADDDGDDPIFVRHLNQNALRRVETPWASEPKLIRWTRDGRWLIVRQSDQSRGELWKISPYGEAPKLICQLPGRGFVWSDSVDYIDDNTLIVGLAPAGLWTVPEGGGRMTSYLEPGGENEILVQPRVVPGTDVLMFLEIDGGTIELLIDGERRTVYDFGGDRLSSLDVAPDGTILISCYSGSLSRGTYRLVFDPVQLKTTGDPLLIAPQGEFDIAENGTLAIAPRTISDPVMRELVWVNRDGTIAETVASGLPNATNVSLSIDANRAAMSIISSATLGTDEPSHDIMVIDLATGARYELGDTAGSDHYPFWSADAERLIYSTYNAGIRRSSQRAASGAGQPEIVFPRSLITRPSDDGRYLLSSIDAIYYRVVGDSEDVVFNENPSNNFDLTSDSRYIAYTPGSAGDGIWIERFPDGGAITTATTMDAWGLSWANDNSALYFWVDEAFWEAPVDVSGPQPVVGQARMLFTVEETGIAKSRIYGIGDDGRFLMLKNPDGTRSEPGEITVNVVQNWLRQSTRN
jgi:serine/threonine protein kinase